MLLHNKKQQTNKQVIYTNYLHNSVQSFIMCLKRSAQYGWIKYSTIISAAPLSGLTTDDFKSSIIRNTNLKWPQLSPLLEFYWGQMVSKWISIWIADFSLEVKVGFLTMKGTKMLQRFLSVFVTLIRSRMGKWQSVISRFQQCFNDLGKQPINQYNQSILTCTFSQLKWTVSPQTLKSTEEKSVIIPLSLGVGLWVWNSICDSILPVPFVWQVIFT